MSRSDRFILTYCLCVCLSLFCFDMMLCSNLRKNNSDAGHIKCSHGLHLAYRFPTPALQQSKSKIMTTLHTLILTGFILKLQSVASETGRTHSLYTLSLRFKSYMEL